MSSTWLDQHLEEFVRPRLGYVPNLDPNNSWVQYVTPAHIAYADRLWDAAKIRCGGRPILLPGRDVWLFEILARLEDYPTTFRPDISSSVAPFVREDYREFYCVDTGYRGSVPLAMGIKNFGLVSYRPGILNSPAIEAERQLYQLIPNPGTVPALSTMMETMPKYWARAEMPQGQLVLANPLPEQHYMWPMNKELIRLGWMDQHAKDHFTDAAQVTMQIAINARKRQGLQVRSMGRGI